MCLNIYNKDYKIKVADKPIIVFKVGRVRGEIFEPRFKDSFKYYLMLKTILVPIVPVEPGLATFPITVADWIVDEGYHSYKHLSDAENQVYHGSALTIGVFVIPIGTKYIEGSFDNNPSYVSEELIYLGSYWIGFIRNPFTRLRTLKFKKK